MKRQRVRERPRWAVEEVEGAEELVLKEAEARFQSAEDAAAVAEVDSNSNYLTTFELELPRWSSKTKT